MVNTYHSLNSEEWLFPLSVLLNQKFRFKYITDLHNATSPKVARDFWKLHIIFAVLTEISVSTRLKNSSSH